VHFGLASVLYLFNVVSSFLKAFEFSSVCHVGVFRLFDVSKVQSLRIPYKHFNISDQTLTFEHKKRGPKPP
jgi:hypothetical protein